MAIRSSAQTASAHLAAAALACRKASAQQASGHEPVTPLFDDVGGPLLLIALVFASALWLTIVTSVLSSPAPPRRAAPPDEAPAVREEVAGLSRAVRRTDAKPS